MPLFSVQGSVAPGRRLALTGDDAHHLAGVLRVRVGEMVRLAAADCLWSARVESVVRGEVVVRVEGVVEPVWRPPRRVHLYAAVVKGKAMERLIAHASELGACDLTPILTDHTVVRANPARAARWHAVAAAAQRQCGRPEPLEIHPVAPLAACLDDLADGLVAHPGGPPLALPGGGGVVRLVLGPEGGLSDGEVTALTEAGATLFGLAGWTLRAPTAAAAALAVVQGALEAQARATEDPARTTESQARTTESQARTTERR